MQSVYDKVRAFILNYKTNEIIYPSAVARACHIYEKAARETLETLKENGEIRPLYMARCPCCSLDTGYKYDNIGSIEYGTEVGCPHCGEEFDISDDTINVYYSPC